VHVEPQVFDLLVHLLRNRDRVVSKDELFDTIWKGRIVSEAALSSRINAARKAVGDDGERQA
jgi:DNA-binding winged helix-turn-helix (wHTH) protein